MKDFYESDDESSSQSDLLKPEPDNSQWVKSLRCKSFIPWTHKAPALGAIEPLRLIKFNGTLDYPSAFRGAPSEEVHAAWETVVNRESGTNRRLCRDRAMTDELL
ncbi:MAG: hypothetical protein Q9168_005564 [Polycauliona sp. 1 TL-2023]